MTGPQSDIRTVVGRRQSVRNFPFSRNGGVKGQAKRFGTRKDFLTWLEKQVEAGEMGESEKERQVIRSELIGEVGLLTKAVRANHNPNNPLWECEFTGPGGEKKLRLVAWNEDMACVTTSKDRWAFIDEVNDTEPSDSPDNLDREFIIGMDTNLAYRMWDKVGEAVSV